MKIKKGSFRSIVRDSSIYGVGSIASVFLATLQVLIVSRFISPLEYATVGMFLLVLNLMLPFINLSQHSIVGRLVYSSEESVEIAPYTTAALMNSILALFIISFIYGSLIFFYPRFLEFLPILIPVFVVALVQAFQSYVRSWFQVTRAALSFTLTIVSHQLLILLLSILFIFEISPTAESRIYGHMFASLIIAFGLMVMFPLLTTNRIAISTKMSLILSKSIGFIPHSLFSSLIGNLDKVVVIFILEPLEIGIYLLMAQLAAGIFPAFQPVNNILIPRIYALLDSAKAKFAYKIGLNFIITIMFFLMIMLILIWIFLPYFVNYFLTEDYTSGLVILLILAGYQLLQVSSMLISIIPTYYLRGSLISASSAAALFFLAVSLYWVWQNENTGFLIALCLFFSGVVRLICLICGSIYLTIRHDK